MIATIRTILLVCVLAGPAAAGDGSVDFKDSVLGEVVAWMAKLHGVTIRAPAYVAARKVTVKESDLSFEELVRAVAKAAEATVEIRDGGKTFVLADDWRGRLAKRLQKKSSVAFAGIPMPAAIATIEGFVDAPIICLGRAATKDSTITQLQVESIKAVDLLSLLASFTDSKWEYRWGVVVVGDTATMAAIPADVLTPAEDAKATAAAKATRRRLVDEQLGTEIESTSAAAALVAFTVDTRIVFTVADDAAPAWAKTRSVRLPKGLSLEHALSLLLAPVGLAYEITETGGLRVVVAKK